MSHILSIKKTVFVALFASLTAIGGLIVIPIGVVPITLQTLFVLLSGYILGAKQGALSQIIYICLGLVGLPVYSKGGAGLGHLLGPTGGYIFGFVVASFVVGMIAHKKKISAVGMFFVFWLGMMIIYTLGISQLMFVTKMSFKQALSVGMVMFFPTDLIKIGILSAYVKYVDRRYLA